MPDHPSEEPSGDLTAPDAEPGAENGAAPAPAGNGWRPPSRRSDRDLIEDALNQASPRDDTIQFSGRQILSDTFPGYDILREIHRGGQGVVYLALQKATKRKVAIKVIHGGPFTGSSGKARFEREVQILGQLNNRNIVGIHDSGTTTDGSFFYVMDYISGKSLDEVLRSDERPQVDDTLRLFIKICDAVNAAHLKGVIHRDLKPANIRIDTNGEPIVVDFGLAKVATPDAAGAGGEPALMTMTGQFIGSLPWASPEQAEGTPAAIDVRTDVYSLGVVLYQMLTGKFPYQVVGNMRDVLDNILKAQPARPSSVRRQINNEVETIVLKCLSKNRDRRYQSAGELARDLRHYLNGEPIEAKRDSGLYVIGKTLKRHKIALSVGVAFLVTIIAFGAVMAVLYRKAENARTAELEGRTSLHIALESESDQRRRADDNAHAVFDFAAKTTFAAADQIALLQGGTPALSALVKGSVDRLEKLQPQIKDDPVMLRTLGNAFHRLSEYQSDLYVGRVGDVSDSQKTHGLAAAIRKDLLDYSPNVWTAHYDMALSLYRGAMLLQGRRDYEGSAAELDRAVQEFDKALGLASKAPVESAAELQSCKRSRMLAMRVRCYVGLRMAEDAPRETTEDLAMSDGRVRQAEALYAALEPRLEAMTTASEAPLNDRGEARRQLAAVWDERAKCLLLSAENRKRAAEIKVAAKDREGSLGDYENALVMLQKAFALSTRANAEFETLRAGDPQGADREADLFASNHALGDAAMVRAEVKDSAADRAGFDKFDATRRADHQEALNLFTKALGHAQSAKNSDPSRVKFSRNLAIAHLKFSKEHAALGDLARATAACDESLRLRRDLLRYDAVNRHKRDLGAGLFKVAQIARLTAAAATGGGEGDAQREAAWTKAETNISEARTLFEQLRDLGVLPLHSEEVKETLREQATLWMQMGIAAKGEGRLPQATALFHQAKGNLLISGSRAAPMPNEATLETLDRLLQSPN